MPNLPVVAVINAKPGSSAHIAATLAAAGEALAVAPAIHSLNPIDV